MLDHSSNPTQFPEMLEDFITAERNQYSGLVGLMDRTDRPHYNQFCEGIIGCLKPANPLERLLAFSIAADYWRLNRTRNIEDGIFASSHPNPTSDFGPTPIEKQIAASQTSAFLCRQSDFKFLSTYEMRIQRTLNRHKTELKQLQTERGRLESRQPAPWPGDQSANTQTQQDSSGPGLAISDPSALDPEDPPSLGRVFKANQQSGLIPTNTEAQRDTSGQGFAFSNPLSASVPAPQTPDEQPRE